MRCRNCAAVFIVQPPVAIEPAEGTNDFGIAEEQIAPAHRALIVARSKRQPAFHAGSTSRTGERGFLGLDAVSIIFLVLMTLAFVGFLNPFVAVAAVLGGMGMFAVGCYWCARVASRNGFTILHFVIPLYNFVFALRRWDVMKRPVLCGVRGLVVFLVAAVVGSASPGWQPQAKVVTHPIEVVKTQQSPEAPARHAPLVVPEIVIKQDKTPSTETRTPQPTPVQPKPERTAGEIDLGAFTVIPPKSMTQSSTVESDWVWKGPQGVELEIWVYKLKEPYPERYTVVTTMPTSGRIETMGPTLVSLGATVSTEVVNGIAFGRADKVVSTNYFAVHNGHSIRIQVKHNGMVSGWRDDMMAAVKTFKAK
jgi:hypothetical protein